MLGEDDDTSYIPERAFLLQFQKGSEEDKSFLFSWLSATQESPQRVPGEWKLERHVRFGAWCQLMGFTCEWEGGYLFIRLTDKNWRNVRYVALHRDDLEIPATPAPTTPEHNVEDLQSQLECLHVSLPPPPPPATAVAKRNRQRVWQDHDAVGGFELNGRRSSVVAARPSLLQRSSMARASLHYRASMAAARQSMFPIIDEDEEEESTLSLLSDDLLYRILDFVSVRQVLCELTTLNKSWHAIAMRHANLHFATSFHSPLPAAHYFQQHHSSATFLGEGAYKSVYLLNKTEAVSVMDITRTAHTVVSREVTTSLILSDLVQQRVCPNFIKTNRVFQLDASPPWGTGKSKPGHYQYISMELCEYGDLEEYMKTFPGAMLPLEITASTVFQMLYSVFVARQAVKMRHYDIKCLNFFCKATADTLTYSVGSSNAAACAGKMLAKLADYGTADLDPTNVGQRIDLCHLTTLENTPIEFLLFPDAVQSFACDVFQLGLSVFHVLTGGLPYEEILQQVKCPALLKEEVSRVWHNAGFDVVQLVVEDDVEDVMFHTLYRFLVLFGFGAEDGGKEKLRFHPSRSKVISLARATLVESQSTSKKAKAARKQFAEDVALYSFRSGTHHLIARGRERAKTLGMYEDLVWGLLDYCPELRLTTRQALQHSKAFSALTTNVQAEFGVGLFDMAEEKDAF